MTFALMAAMAALSSDVKPLACAVMPDNVVNAKAAGIEYAGVKYTFCCGMCPPSFSKNPQKYIKSAVDDNLVIGTSLFDPISGERVDLKKATLSSDFKGTRFFFTSDEEKASFDKEPAKFAKAPDQESLICAISGEKIADYGSAAGYVDFDNVRYYACCPSCFPSMKKDPASLKSNPKVVLSAPKALMGKNNEPHKHDGGK